MCRACILLDMSQQSIATAFVRAKTSGPFECPVCGNRASQREINEHLDQGCPTVPTTDRKVAADESSASASRQVVLPTGIDKDDDAFTDSDSEFEKIQVDSLPNGNTEKLPEATENPPMLVNGTSFNNDRQSPAKSKRPSSSSPLKHIPFTQSKRQDPDHVPYYVANFTHILDCVLNCTDDWELFLTEELNFVETYRNLRLDAQKLYVRLFQRKHAWIMKAAIKYEEISDLDAALKDLIAAGMIEDPSELQDLDIILSLLTAPNLKNLCKEMHLVAAGGQKTDHILALQKHARQRTVSFFGARSAHHVVKRKASSLLGSCYRVKDTPRAVFMRILSLYSLSNWWEERENDKGQTPQQLTTILLVNQGKMTFPVVDVIRQRKLFICRDQLLKFESVCALESRMSEAFEAKDWANAATVLEEAQDVFNETLADKAESSHIEKLPVFLRRFGRGSVLAYILTKGVEVLERCRKYKEATELLRALTSQHLYLPDYHGHWYERLVLDLDNHLKRPRDSLTAIREGLGDDNVRIARRLALCQRVSKICRAKKNEELKEVETEFKSLSGWLEAGDTPSVTIQGRLMPKDNLPGSKTIFVHDAGNGERLLCSVEEYVREYYKSLGFQEGLHAEGAVVNTIAAVLFWEALYNSPVPDAFRSPNQGAPLDFNSDDFYTNRREVINTRLDDLESWTQEEMQEYVEFVWSKNYGTVSVVNWELFTGPEQFMGLIKCFTRAQLKGICERLIKNHRYTRSGFPDLTVWNPDTKRVMIVEVKGPNDRLSNKQILWIKYLNELDVESVVCHVEAIGGKLLDRKSPIKFKKSPSKSSLPSTKPISQEGTVNSGALGDSETTKVSRKRKSARRNNSGERIEEIHSTRKKRREENKLGSTRSMNRTRKSVTAESLDASFEDFA